MPDTRLTIPAAALSLEAVLTLPEQRDSPPLVVICHPHPQYGGDMHNNVVTAITRALTMRGIAALRFNFRGTGASGGAYDNGAGEREDVRAALAHAATLPGINRQRIGLAGYSFGAAMAAANAGPDIAALALVALPVSMAAGAEDALRTYNGPLLLVSGDQDHVSPEERLLAFAGALGRSESVTLVPGVDHFWFGHEQELDMQVGEFFALKLL